MDEKTALVPLNVNQLEALPINGERRLNADDKKKLLEVLNKAIQEKEQVLRARWQEVESEILQKEKENANLDKYRKEMDDLEAEITAICEKKAKVEARCKNETGFTIEGELLKEHRHYREEDDEYKLRKLSFKKGIDKAKRIEEKIELAKKSFDRFSLKFDKIQTRLILADTYKEAMSIMDAVLGNGDEILNPETKEESQ